MRLEEMTAKVNTHTSCQVHPGRRRRYQCAEVEMQVCLRCSNIRGAQMGEGAGVLAAVLSSAIGGASIGVTRFIAGAIDPLAIGAFRFGIGFLLLLPIASG